MRKTMAVYCSSSNVLETSYYKVTEELGAWMVRHEYDLVFGGSRVGLMGTLARSVQSHGGHVIGVIPKLIMDQGIAYEDADELIVTKDLRERKKIMEDRADAFLALPGGFGTLEEILEILTLKQLQAHSKPVVLLNVQGFFNSLVAQFECMYDRHFAKKEHRDMYCIADSCESVFSYLTVYKPSTGVRKWTG